MPLAIFASRRAWLVPSRVCRDMSRNGKQDRARSNVWLRRNELRAWLAFMRVQQRLGYEMNRQLQADSALSLADYDVLNALGAVPDRAHAGQRLGGPDRLGAEPVVSSR